jgi:membrane peptidoglycan carboxypeptidase
VSNDRTLHRKFREAAYAYQLEKTWSKKKILDQYLNIVYFGEGAYGVEAAAQTYFGVHASQLTLAQAALLAGIPKGPSLYDPRRGPEAARKRRNLVLSKMLEQKSITAAELQAASATPVKLVSSSKETPTTVPYWVEMVREQLIARYGSSTVLGGGLRVYLSVDLKRQKAAEDAITGVLDQPGDPSAALVSIDLHTGRMVAMVGGADFNKQQFNLALQGHRQPGSAFKPFVLVTAFEEGMSPQTVYDSGPITIPMAGEPWDVNSQDQGRLSLSDATAVSSNGVFARLIIDVGADKVAKTAKRMGIHSALGDTPTPAIALGGLENGVTPLEMAMAYAPLATGGLHLSADTIFDPDTADFPLTIVKVTDAAGKVVDEPKLTRSQVLDPGLAALTTSALEKVITEGTGKAAKIGRVAAGKTGTTSDYRDAWFVGYTPDLVTAVWVGYADEQTPMTDVHGISVTGGSLPAQIWAAYMKQALKGVKATDFPQTGLEAWTTVEVCSESHDLPTQWCPSTVKLLFKKGEEPSQKCTVHKPKTVDVPSVQGLTLLQAKAVLTNLGLKTASTEDPLATEPAGTVTGQNPGAGEKLEQGRTVTLLVSAAPTGVAVPGMVDLDLKAARKLAADRRLVLVEEGRTSDKPVGTVLEQAPPEGTMVTPGSSVTIYVSSGPASTTTTTSPTTTTTSPTTTTRPPATTTTTLPPASTSTTTTSTT